MACAPGLARSGAIGQLAVAGRARAVGAAIELAAGLHPVADDEGRAGRATRRHRLDRAGEGVEDVGRPTLLDGDRLVVLVATDFAGGHGRFLGWGPVGRRSTARAAPIGRSPASW